MPDDRKDRRLDEAIDAVTRSYDDALEINNLESAALPNRRAVIEAFLHLPPVIYMGFYSKGALDRSNLRESIQVHLRPAFSSLVEQIGRAVTYETNRGSWPGQRALDFAEEVVYRLYGRLPELRRILNTDVAAAFAGDPAANSVEEIVFSYPIIRALTAHRIAHVLYAEGVPMIPRILSEHAHSETGIDIHAGATIGEHFFIDHGTGVVIGETSVIGNNVKLYQGVTLGALSAPRNREAPNGTKRHPTLEDDVTVYAGATILGGQTVIGAGSVIGGNVWLDRSVPPNSKLFGRPRE